MRNMRALMTLSEGRDDPRSDAAFRKWFGNSVVVDNHGKPLIVYRGEHGEYHSGGAPFQSRLGALSFGTVDGANAYADDGRGRNEAPRVYPVYLSIQKPVMNREDPYLEFSDVEDAIGWDKACAIFLALSGFVEDTSNYEDNFDDFESVADVLDRAPDRMRELYVTAYRVFDEQQFVKWFRDAGYDGAVHWGNGETALEYEYKIFDQRQARSAISG